MSGKGRDIAAYHDTHFNGIAKSAIIWTTYKLSIEERKFLHQLPSSQTMLWKGSESITVIHGSPAYPLDEYIY